MTKEEIVTAAQLSDGLITKMARSLHISAVEAESLLEEYPLAKDALLCARADLCTNANAMLKLAVKQGQQWAVERVLDTWGKKDELGNVKHIDVTSNGKTLDTGVVVVPGISADEDAWSEENKK